jgi:hypothetical protein
VAVKSALLYGEPVVGLIDFSTFVDSEFHLAEESGAVRLFDDTNNLTVLFNFDVGSAERNVETLSNGERSDQSVVAISNWVDQSGII